MTDRNESGAKPLLYSIVVALPDDAGRPVACVESWARMQRFAREKIEVVVVTNRDRCPQRAAIAAQLDPRDSLLAVTSSNRFALYDVGAAQARGRTLLFTEAHCAAEPTCLAELDRYLADTPYAGAALHCQGDSIHWLARFEERAQAEEMEERSRPGDWRKVNVRGFAVKRSVYLEVGGFEPRYSHFAGFELAARLHRCGHRFGYARRATVRRYDESPSLEAVLAGIRRFAEGESRFRSSHCEEDISPYFGLAPEFVDRDRYAGGRLRFPLARARWRVRRAARRLRRRSGDPVRGFRAFQEFTAAVVHASRVEYLRRRPSERSLDHVHDRNRSSRESRT